MLLQFSINNFKSIKDTTTLSLIATKKDKEKENYSTIQDYKILNSAAIYGANASGKSNVLSALELIKRIILNQDKVIQSTDKLEHNPFKLFSETANASSWFEIVFFTNHTKYRYGFELDSSKIYSEWLYASTKGKEAKLFFRDNEESDYVNPNKFKEGISYFNKNENSIKISGNQLFLWKCDQDGGCISKEILSYFNNNLNILNATNHKSYLGYTENIALNKLEFKNQILKLIQNADINIEDININKQEQEISIQQLPPDIISKIPIDVIEKSNTVIAGTIDTKMIHKKFDENNNHIEDIAFDLQNDESTGTEKLFAIAGPILDTLKKGKTLIIDELDNSLHPLLTKTIIGFFHNKNLNTKNAQLIFATHDSNLLKHTIFRRDQIWFTEKDKYGASDLYSLAQFKGVNKNINFENGYMQGKYGAIPYLGDFDF